jgi:hypothetical protein
MDNEDKLIGQTSPRKPKLTREEVAQEQRVFLNKLALKMEENGHTIADVSRVLGIPYSYIVAIKNGMHRIAKADQSTVEKFANYLDVPLVQIYIWSGFLKPVHFISKRTMKDALNQAYDRMTNDPIMATVVPSAMDWNNSRKWSEEAKLTITRLYEMLSNQLFLKHANVPLDKESEKVFLNYMKKF